ncbi:MAG: hypothetical protein DPW09_04010 [Anaerolineae bacterium]|nr:hypothetical protein [Anaerolineae bacterium]
MPFQGLGGGNQGQGLIALKLAVVKVNGAQEQGDEQDQEEGKGRGGWRVGGLEGWRVGGLEVMPVGQ